MVNQQETLFLPVVKYLLSLGSNLGNRSENLARARKELERSFGSIISASSVYETPPWGFEAERVFYNQVVCVVSEMEPVEFLKEVLQIEKSQGRERKNQEGYASRIIDIDLLMVNELVVDSNELTIPHPEMHNRRFVLVPSVEIVPNWRHPVFNCSLNELLKVCADQSEITRI